MNAIALVLIACLPHVGQCKSIVQHPTPATDRECTERAANLQHTLEAERGLEPVGRRVKAPTLPLPRRVRAPAREGRIEG
jgi:hypothetical protein